MAGEGGKGMGECEKEEEEIEVATRRQQEWRCDGFFLPPLDFLIIIDADIATSFFNRFPPLALSSGDRVVPDSFIDSRAAFPRVSSLFLLSAGRPARRYCAACLLRFLPRLVCFLWTWCTDGLFSFDAVSPCVPLYTFVRQNLALLAASCLPGSSQSPSVALSFLLSDFVLFCFSPACHERKNGGSCS